MCLHTQGPHLEPGPEEGPVSEHLVARFITESSQAKPKESTGPLLHPVGPPPKGRTAVCRQTEPRWHRLALGTWNVTLLGGEVAGACAGGGALPIRSGGAHFHAQRRHFKQTPGEYEKYR